MKKGGKRLWELWGTMRRNNICIMRIPEIKEKVIGSILEAIIVEKFQTWNRSGHPDP